MIVLGKTYHDQRQFCDVYYEVLVLGVCWDFPWIFLSAPPSLAPCAQSNFHDASFPPPGLPSGRYFVHLPAAPKVEGGSHGPPTVPNT